MKHGLNLVIKKTIHLEKNKDVSVSIINSYVTHHWNPIYGRPIKREENGLILTYSIQD
jgi:hypothetical protein